MGKPYRECKFCGAHLDAGEICDCRKPKREPQTWRESAGLWNCKEGEALDSEQELREMYRAAAVIKEICDRRTVTAADVDRIGGIVELR